MVDYIAIKSCRRLYLRDRCLEKLRASDFGTGTTFRMGIRCLTLVQKQVFTTCKNLRLL